MGTFSLAGRAYSCNLMVLRKLRLLATNVPSSLAVNYMRPIIVTRMCVCLFYTCAAAVQTSTSRLTAFDYIKLHIAIIQHYSDMYNVHVHVASLTI